MYVNQPNIPIIRRQRKEPKKQPPTRPGKTVGLSKGLHQGLVKDLYKGLHQGFRAKPQDPLYPQPQAVDAGRAVQRTLRAEVGTPTAGTDIRQISLLLGETVSHTFCPEEGLISHPKEQGRMLVLTNQRVIAFGHRDGVKETILMPVEEVKAVAVNVGHRSKGMLLQGGLIMLAGVVIYVLLAYWLTGRVDGPTIPVIRMDLVAFLVFLIVLSSVALMSQIYFGRPDGEATFQGDGVRLAFPFSGATAEDDIYQMVNATFAARQLVVSHYGLAHSEPGVP